MKTLFGILLVGISIAATAQQYRMVNGQIYRSDDLSVWRTFYDLQIVAICPDGDLEVREIFSNTESYQVAGPRRMEADNTSSTFTSYGEPFRLINYRCSIAPYPGMDLGTVKAMLEPVTLRGNTRIVTTAATAASASVNDSQATIAAVSYASQEEQIASSAYDVGRPWYPPQPVFTKAQIAEQKFIANSNIVIFLKQQATNGMPDQQCELGERYLKGDGVPQDQEAGTMWLRKAADQGSLEASNELQSFTLTNSIVVQK